MNFFTIIFILGLTIIVASQEDNVIKRRNRRRRRFDRFNTNPNKVDRSQSRNLALVSASEEFVTATFPELVRECKKRPECADFRTIKHYQADGSCNNPFDPARGMAERPFKRLLPADYSDGIGTPRGGSTNIDLPSARYVSNMMTDENSTPPISNKTTVFVPFWGQFMIHDVTSTPTATREPDEIDCDCKSTDPECINIELDPTDIQYESGKDCLPVVRSKPVPNEECDSSIREQINSISAYLDASNVYGTNKEDLHELLDEYSDHGELKVGNNKYTMFFEPGPILPLTPQAPSVKTACPFDVHKPEDIPCFVAGDERVNENPSLTSIHHMFLSHHNRIVRELSTINPLWTKEKLVNTARLIVATLTQRITYDLFLPMLLGPEYMSRFHLELLENGHSYGYDASYDASVSNAFAAAAFRMGHTLIRGQITRYDQNWNTVDPTLVLHKNFFNSESFISSSTGRENSILRGITNLASHEMDSQFSQSLHNFLFPPIEGGFGSDLMAINIQRGRDHGIPGYNKFRELCGLKRATSFEDFTDIPEESRIKLQFIYKNIVDDVDLFIAGISETPVDGGLVGPTFACIIGYQFRDLKKGDRFWHENGGAHTVFSLRQLAALRKYSLSRMICDYADGTLSVQPNPLVLPTANGNGRRRCISYPRLNLEPWREQTIPESNPPSLNFILTTKFPIGAKEEEGEAYNRLLLSRTDDICSEAHGSKVTTLRSGQKLIQFKCLPGTIRGTFYPPITRNAVWSQWETTRKTDVGDDIELRSYNHVCVKPIAIQAQTIKGVPARKTGDVFEELSPSRGLVCRKRHQQDRRCFNYKVRYLCTSLRED